MTDDSLSRRAAARSPARRIALVAHDHKKQDLREWADHNRELLSRHVLVATGTTGRLLADELGLQVSACRAARSAATSRSARSSRPAAWTC